VIVESGEYGGGVDVGRHRGCGMEIMLAHIGVADFGDLCLGAAWRTCKGVICRRVGRGRLRGWLRVMCLRVQITKTIGTRITIRKCTRKGTKYRKLGYRNEDLKTQKEQEIKAGGEADAWRRPFCAE
jgi:hypothetical protein